MKIGQVEFTWRAHRQACVVQIGGEQRVFRFNKKTTRKELFAKIRSLIAEAAGTQKVCQHCGKHYFGVNSHNFLCGDCAQQAADIHREGVGNIKEFSLTEPSARIFGLPSAICWSLPARENLWDLSLTTPNGLTTLKLCSSRCGAMKTVTVSIKVIMHSVFMALSPTPAKKTIFSLPPKTVNIDLNAKVFRSTMFV